LFSNGFYSNQIVQSRVKYLLKIITTSNECNSNEFNPKIFLES